MKRVPSLMVLLPCWRQGSRRQGGDTIVDGHQGSDCVQNRCQPDRQCDKTEDVRWGVPTKIGLNGQKHETKYVPERHKLAQAAGKKTQSSRLRTIVQLPDCRIEEPGDGKLNAGQRAAQKDRYQVENAHRASLESHSLLTRVLVDSTQTDVLVFCQLACPGSAYALPANCRNARDSLSCP